MACCRDNYEDYGELSDDQLEKIRAKVIKDEQRWKAETLDVSQLNDEEVNSLYFKVVGELNIRNLLNPVKFVNVDFDYSYGGEIYHTGIMPCGDSLPCPPGLLVNGIPYGQSCIPGDNGEACACVSQNSKAMELRANV